MKTLIFCLLTLLLISCAENSSSENGEFELVEYDAVDVEKTNSTNLYIHYMPWYESKEVDGYWGSHWTMNTQNPDNVTDDKREIASHFYPVIGPYSSNDPDLVEYHLLLMKLSGIDGVLVDWYGTYDVFDYAQNLINSNALIDRTDDVKLDFGIVYEDRTTENVKNQGQAGSAVEAAINDFNYIKANYFSKENYIKIDGENLLLVFTPVHIQSGNQWQQILNESETDPLFLAIWGESGDLGSSGDGEFAWVYNGNNNHLGRLRTFYSTSSSMFKLGSAYPGFKDFYQQGGWGAGIGWEIAHNETQTLTQTLELASEYNATHLQLVTWNDFGEGTMLEPTLEFGYSLLGEVQQFTGVSFDTNDLEYVTRLYELRKTIPKESPEQLKLDQAYYYFISLQIDEAKAILDELEE